ncbi:MAG: ECF-type sigma factor [Planctomycetota bacterium]
MAESRDRGQVTEILARVTAGDDRATEILLPLLYDELRSLARAFFRRPGKDHTLQPTALVHEAFLKLTRGKQIDWESRAHFFAVAAKAMRQILANHAESKRAQKRGGDRNRVTLSGLGTPMGQEEAIDLIDLDAAMTKLAGLSPRQAEIVTMRFLTGMEEEEIAHALGTSARTVRREWRMARAFLKLSLSGEGLE